MKITLNKLMSWEPCEEYTEERVLKITKGRKSLTPLEVSKLRISIEDRIWVLLRPDVLGNDFIKVVNKIADRAVRKHCLKCGIKEVEIWATKWLSGEDRSWTAARFLAIYLDTYRAAVLVAVEATVACCAGIETWEAAETAVEAAEDAVGAALAVENAKNTKITERKCQLNLIKKYL